MEVDLRHKNTLRLETPLSRSYWTPSLNNDLGGIGERFVAELLEPNGYRIRRQNCGFCSYDGTGIRCFKDSIHGHKVSACPFGEQWWNLIKYVQELRRGSKGTGRSSKGVKWDFYATKGNEEYIIEVKTGRQRLGPLQKKVLNRAKTLGYIPILIRVNLGITIHQVSFQLLIF